MAYRGIENIEYMEKALLSRIDLIDKYDERHENHKNKLEIKWINHVFKKIQEGWIPDEQDVTIEVERTIGHGLYLRRENLEKSHQAIQGIEISITDADIISVDFSKK